MEAFDHGCDKDGRMTRDAPESLSAIEQSPEWQTLLHHRRAQDALSLAGLFRDDPRRFRQFSLHAAGLLFDYSKNLITAETMALLLALAEKAGVPAAIERL